MIGQASESPIHPAGECDISGVWDELLLFTALVLLGTTLEAGVAVQKPYSQFFDPEGPADPVFTDDGRANLSTAPGIVGEIWATSMHTVGVSGAGSVAT